MIEDKDLEFDTEEVYEENETGCDFVEIGEAGSKDGELDDFEEDDEDEKIEYPFIALRGLTIFPNTVMHFDIGRDKSKRALEQAMNTDRLMFVASQMDDEVLIPSFSDVYRVGTLIRVKQMLKLNGDVVRVLVEGIRRGRIDEEIAEEDYMVCTVDFLPDEIDESVLSLEDKAAVNVLCDKYMDYASVTGQITDEVVSKTLSAQNPMHLVYRIASSLMISYTEKQKILEAAPFAEKVRLLTTILYEECDMAELEKTLMTRVKESIDKNQKEYFLKERIKAINEELGYSEDPSLEADEWLRKLNELNLDEDITVKIQKEIKRFTLMGSNSAEASVIRTYVETILDLPWNKSSKVNINLKKAEKILNRDHYGLDKVKERIIEYLAVMHLSKSIKGPILCLVGPPGVGKTSIARSVAAATGREFVRMSLGGVRDEAEIRGHRRTYIGAIPGRVITLLKECKSNNPLFLFDEIDKIGSDFRGDPADALLEVLDPEQNSTFTDHYLEVPFDLSKVLFITTANSLDTIPRPLLDRMEVIEINGYTEEEKLNIAQKYLVPKKVKEHGLKKDSLKISEQGIRDIINYYTRESGVRNLEREIANICRKAATVVVTEKKKSFSVASNNLDKFLGKKKYHYDVVEGKSEIAVVTGMAWTSVGGETLSVETAILEGTGKIELTGQLGDVMQESAKTAISYVRSVASELDIAADFYKTKDIHIHVPEGAVPKDGPSAGVTIFTSVVSALTGIPVRKDVAMTGEITLRGRVLPVGGIKEKVLAAHRAGIKTILLPKDNLVDTDELPSNVKKHLRFVPLEYARETLDEALDKK